MKIEGACVIEVCFNHRSKKSYYLDLEHAQQQYHELIDAWTAFLEKGTPKVHHLVEDDKQGKVSLSLDRLESVEFQLANDITVDRAVRHIVAQKRHAELMEERIKQALDRKTGF